MKSAALAILLLAPLARGAEAPPNIVYILADDLGYGDVRCLNPDRGKIQTPHLDRFAAQGMVFTDAHSGSSVCTPTRYGLLTGRYAWRTRLQAGVLDGGSDEPLIAAERLTVPGFLRDRGYATACIGKWHLGFLAEVIPAQPAKKLPMGSRGLPVGASIIGGPTTRGFDLFIGCSNARTMSAFIENVNVTRDMATVDMLPALAGRAVAYIEEKAAAARSGKPFFLYLPLTSPHTPIVPSPEWRGKSRINAYADFVMQTDAVAGQVLAALDSAGVADNTLVIFTADNGCSPAAKLPELHAAGHFPSADRRGHKADLWEGGHRVPFLVRWPGKVRPGSQSAQTICHTDLFATCADLLGAELPGTAAEDSASILPALLGADDGRPLREATVHHSIDGRFAIRQGNWKLLFSPGSGGWGAPTDAAALKEHLPAVQLYDLSEDPGETKNLQAARPEIVASLTGLLRQYIERGRSTPGAAQKNDVPVSSPFIPPIQRAKDGRSAKKAA